MQSEDKYEKAIEKRFLQILELVFFFFHFYIKWYAVVWLYFWYQAAFPIFRIPSLKCWEILYDTVVMYIASRKKYARGFDRISVRQFVCFVIWRSCCFCAYTMYLSSGQVDHFSQNIFIFVHCWVIKATLVLGNAPETMFGSQAAF